MSIFPSRVVHLRHYKKSVVSITRICHYALYRGIPFATAGNEVIGQHNKKKMDPKDNNLFTMLREVVNADGLRLSDDLKEFLDPPESVNLAASGIHFAKLAIHQLYAIVDDKELGLKVAKFISPNVFNGLGYLFMTAANIKTGFERIGALPALYHNIVDIRTEVTGDSLRVTVSNDMPHPEDSAMVNEGAIGILVNYLQWVLHHHKGAIHVAFSHPNMTTPERYTHYLGLTPAFSQPQSCITLPLADAEKPLHSADADYHQMLLEKLSRKQADFTHRFSEKVRESIRANLPTGTHTKSVLAQLYNMSEKTLDRRLAEEEITFRDLVMETRKELAQLYLSNSKYSLDDIAQLLGYSDRSAFSKAYKNWTGYSPRAESQHS